MQLVISEETIGPLRIVVVKHHVAHRCLCIPVLGIVGNSVPTSETGKRRLKEWKQNVATRTKQLRGLTPWDSSDNYAISVGFSFHPAAHGRQPLDVENFLKPSLDALAAGLFCPNEQDTTQIARYGYDDSNFRYLFVQRLPDAGRESEEGAVFFVSVGGNAT